MKKFNITFGFLNEKEKLSESYSITNSNSENERPPKPKKPSMILNDLFSIFGQAIFTLNEKLNLFIGSRYDSSDYYGDVLTPRAGVIYKKSIYTGKLLYTEAFRAPKPWDYTDGLGNKDLKPEEIDSIEFSNIFEITNNLRLETSIYKNNMDNLLVKEFIDNNWRWINYGEVETKGFEFMLIYKWKRLKGSFDYTFNDSEDEEGKQAPEISKHTSGFQLYYYLNDNLGSGFRCRYYGKRENPKIISSTGNNKIDSAFVCYTSINFKISKELSGQIAIDNLFNSVYYHSSNLPPDRYRQPGRAFRFWIGYDF